MKLVLESITIIKKIIKMAALVLIVLLISGCTRLVFHPDKISYSSPDKFGLNYEDVFLETKDSVKLHGWFLKTSKEATGTVFFLHGNAQNVSAHIYSVAWLPKNGYQVFILDYRGFGKSTGYPSYSGSIDDIDMGFTWLIQNSMVKGKPVYLLGQSLGASLGIFFVGNNPELRDQLTGVIIDSGFSNLRTIVLEKLAGFWLTRIFQYPLSWLFTDKYNAEDFIQNISPVPVLIMHSKEDRVIPYTHGKRLFELARPPKFFKQTRNGHISTFKFHEYRKEMLDFMKQAALKCDSTGLCGGKKLSDE